MKDPAELMEVMPSGRLTGTCCTHRKLSAILVACVIEDLPLKDLWTSGAPMNLSKLANIHVQVDQACACRQNSACPSLGSFEELGVLQGQIFRSVLKIFLLGTYAMLFAPQNKLQRLHDRVPY